MTQENIDTFASQELNWSADLTFAAKRSDGLGERLRAIIFAKALADYYGKSFAFDWRKRLSHLSDEHAVGDAKEIFSLQFIEKYSIPDLEGLPLTDFIHGNVEETPCPFIIAPPAHLESKDPIVRDLVPFASFADAFWSLGFSDKINRAIALANAIDLHEETASIHLRSGDVIYGKYRFMHRWHEKVVPYQLAIKFLENERLKGASTVLFGQDAEFNRALCSLTGALFAGDFHEEYAFDKYEAAIFDVVLMSRCKRVVAGTSGFALLAQAIGQFERLKIQKIFSSEDVVSILLEDCLKADEDTAEIKIPPLQKAFSCCYLVRQYGQDLPSDKRIEVLEKALSLDPENSYYGISLSMEYAVLEDFERAEAELDRWLVPSRNAETHGTLLAVIKERTPPNSRWVIEDYRETLKTISDHGGVAASAICAALAGAEGNKLEFEVFLERSKDLRRSPLSRRLEVLKLPNDIERLRSRIEMQLTQILRLRSKLKSVNNELLREQISHEKALKKQQDENKKVQQILNEVIVTENRVRTELKEISNRFENIEMEKSILEEKYKRIINSRLWRIVRPLAKLLSIID